VTHAVNPHVVCPKTTLVGVLDAVMAPSSPSVSMSAIAISRRTNLM